MKTEQFFKQGKNKINWIGSSFETNFSGMDFTIPQKLKLQHKTLEKSMLDKEILEQWKPRESTLGELAYALKHEKNLLKNDYANIFYIRNNNNTLWAVYAIWYAAYGWRVDARPVDYPPPWSGGSQVLSRKFGVLGSLDSGDLEDRVKVLEDKFNKIKELL